MDTVKTLREEYCFKKAHADECVNDKALVDKGSVEEALEWLASSPVAAAPDGKLLYTQLKDMLDRQVKLGVC